MKFNKVSTAIVILLAAVLVAAVGVALFITLYAIPHGNEIASIRVESLPNKLEYYVTDRANYTGLQIRVTRNNGEYFLVSPDACTFTGFDSSKPVQRQTVTIDYQGHTTELYIRINPLPTLAPTLVSMEISTLPKTVYKVGEWLDTTGGVITLHYNDDSTFRINLTNHDVYGFDASVPNEALVLTVKYTQNGVTVETTYTVSVTE